MGPNKAEEREVEQTLTAYLDLLRKYPGWRILWIGEILSNLGNWFSYVATLLVVEELANGRGILISLVLTMRFIPSFFLFPVAGVFADRYDRVNILIVSNIFSGVAVAALSWVSKPSDLWMLYALLFAGFSATAFYDPARRAVTPSLVPRGILHLATTLDSFAWSLTGAVGASLGGLAASHISKRSCFLLDAATYAVSAWCAYRLKTLRQEAVNPGLDCESSGELKAVQKAEAAGHEARLSSAVAGGEVELRSAADPGGILQASGNSQPFLSGQLNSRQVHAAGDEQAAGDEEEGESTALLQERQASGAAAGAAKPAAAGGCALVLHSMKDELAAAKEGWLYVTGSSNRDVAPLVLLKACGSLLWAAADVLNVQFSELPEMQGLGDAAFTLGLFYACVGFACFIGPILFNLVTPPRAPNLLLSSTTCFLFLLCGYLGIAAAGNVFAMCFSIIVKSLGSSVLWVYSTLMLQLRVPDNLLGRILALEMALFTVTECASGMFGGVALDDFGMSMREVSLLMAALSAVVSAVWLPYAARVFLRRPQQPAASP